MGTRNEVIFIDQCRYFSSLADRVASVSKLTKPMPRTCGLHVIEFSIWLLHLNLIDVFDHPSQHVDGGKSSTTIPETSSYLSKKVALQQERFRARLFST